MLCFFIKFIVQLFFYGFALFFCVFVLFCFVLFCFVLFCFVLFCFVLFCFVLFCFVLFFMFFCGAPFLFFILALSSHFVQKY
jgi:hypothetical protein